VTRDSDVGAAPGRSLAFAMRAGLASLCVLAFWDLADHYQGFHIPYGTGIQEIHWRELVFSAWYLVLGIPALLFGAWALHASTLPRSVLDAYDTIARAPRRSRILWAATLAVVAIVFAIRAGLLGFAPVADDESTYLFIARTLLEGRVANPAPSGAADLEFFRNQFIILNEAAWYGKYPIGHPLLLAVGEGLGLRALVSPVLTATTFALSIAVASLAYSRKQAVLAGLLLLLSPQFLLTGATELSQVSSGFCLALSLFALLRLEQSGRNSFAFLAGSALALGVAVRPLPGLLFLGVAALWVALRFRASPIGEQLRRYAVAAVPVAIVGAAMLVVQHLQSGDAMASGYDTFHGGRKGGFLRTDWMAASFWSSALRQNLWLFGWPLSFLFLPFARRSPRGALLWAMVGAAYAYRLILPKTVVASTGPIYVAEVVPVLAILSASGMAECAAWLGRHGFSRGRERIAALAMAATVVAAAIFLPLHLRELRLSSLVWNTSHRMLDEVDAGPSLIFAHRMVDLQQTRTWAYYPPNPSPELDDERIFVRIPRGEDATARIFGFWQEHFPERDAFLFEWQKSGPLLRKLEIEPKVARQTAEAR